jgi:hypothetical protein
MKAKTEEKKYPEAIITASFNLLTRVVPPALGLNVSRWLYSPGYRCSQVVQDRTF